MKRKNRNCEIITRTPEMQQMINRITIEQNCKEALEKARSRRNKRLSLVAIAITLISVILANI